MQLLSTRLLRTYCEQTYSIIGVYMVTTYHTLSDGVPYLTFDTSDETWTIEIGVQVPMNFFGGDLEAVVDSTYVNSSLINYGIIFNDRPIPMEDADGVHFYNDGASIVNAASASIASSGTGVEFDGDGARLVNIGTIIGYFNAGVEFLYNSTPL